MRSTRVLLAALLAVCLLAPVGAQQFRQVPIYNILIVNDDGVRAEGLRHLSSILQVIGNVTIVAPSTQQSGKGHSIVSGEPVFREELTLANGLPAIGLSTTPASTVNIAIRNIVKPRPDLVVSGINNGYNVGYASYVSGTAGAAREAVFHGIPAIAASIAATAAPREYISAAEEVLGVARRLKQYGLPANTYLNVNVPPMPPGGYKGYLVTTQAARQGGEEHFAEAKHPRTGLPIYFSVFKAGGTAPQGTDMWAVENGYVSVTPMKVGETDTAQIDALKGWFK